MLKLDTISIFVCYSMTFTPMVLQVERIKYIHGNNHIHVSVIKPNGDVFSLGLVNPSKSEKVLEDEMSNIDEVGEEIRPGISAETGEILKPTIFLLS